MCLYADLVLQVMFGRARRLLKQVKDSSSSPFGKGRHPREVWRPVLIMARRSTRMGDGGQSQLWCLARTPWISSR
jgi:hypothetical protein